MHVTPRVTGRPPAPEPYTTYNFILFERQMVALRRKAHHNKTSVAALLRDMIDKQLEVPNAG